MISYERMPEVSLINLEKIFEASYDGIMVTDKFGNILLANPAAVKFMEKLTDEVVGANVQDIVKKGGTDRSTTMEAIQKRATFTGLVTVSSGEKVMSTSIPLLDENGEIILVVTNVRPRDLIDQYIDELEKERENAQRYKNAVDYIGKNYLARREPIAKSRKMQQVLQTAKKIAQTDSTVLILGETGTGKEVISNYIHSQSHRNKEPFIPVNCAAIPYELMESEFFGYERGAFSGANARGKPGLFEIANNGTLFLDEIGELPLGLQSKLLRVLESGEFKRVGGTSSQKTNVRLLAATNKNLRDMVKEKVFREDLYYRLNVIPLVLPPLHERPEDVEALAQSFLEELNRKYNYKKRFAIITLQAFRQYEWPGNVRELRNVVERLVITSASDELLLTHELLNPGNDVTAEAKADVANQVALEYNGDLKSFMKKIEHTYIERVLKECNGKIAQAARRLGIHRTLLYRKLGK
ncbi:MAG: domain S-box [Firmicutes bacterium]|nr:domain S-box [Bacillota bacterium]